MPKRELTYDKQTVFFTLQQQQHDTSTDDTSYSLDSIEDMSDIDLHPSGHSENAPKINVRISTSGEGHYVRLEMGFVALLPKMVIVGSFTRN